MISIKWCHDNVSYKEVRCNFEWNKVGWMLSESANIVDGILTCVGIDNGFHSLFYKKQHSVATIVWWNVKGCSNYIIYIKHALNFMNNYSIPYFWVSRNTVSSSHDIHSYFYIFSD